MRGSEATGSNSPEHPGASNDGMAHAEESDGSSSDEEILELEKYVDAMGESWFGAW